MSSDLKKFYGEYWAWLQEGAEERSPFTRRGGLCFNVYQYGRKEGLSDTKIDLLLEEMQEHFIERGLNYSYPFGGAEKFRDEIRSSGCFLNPERRAWVKEYM